jgi:hypothetical protein
MPETIGPRHSRSCRGCVASGQVLCHRKGNTGKPSRKGKLACIGATRWDGCILSEPNGQVARFARLMNVSAHDVTFLQVRNLRGIFGGDGRHCNNGCGGGPTNADLRRVHL